VDLTCGQRRRSAATPAACNRDPRQRVRRHVGCNTGALQTRSTTATKKHDSEPSIQCAITISWFDCNARRGDLFLLVKRRRSSWMANDRTLVAMTAAYGSPPNLFLVWHRQLLSTISASHVSICMQRLPYPIYLYKDNPLQATFLSHPTNRAYRFAEVDTDHWSDLGDLMSSRPTNRATQAISRLLKSRMTY
jgi:hypothetical protein